MKKNLIFSLIIIMPTCAMQLTTQTNKTNYCEEDRITKLIYSEKKLNHQIGRLMQCEKTRDEKKLKKLTKKKEKVSNELNKTSLSATLSEIRQKLSPEVVHQPLSNIPKNSNDTSDTIINLDKVNWQEEYYNLYDTYKKNVELLLSQQFIITNLKSEIERNEKEKEKLRRMLILKNTQH